MYCQYLIVKLFFHSRVNIRVGSCIYYIDELENQNESEITQPELDEQNTILKETSSNNNRCTDAMQTQSQNILNENHCIDADKQET
jgi:hypothetical protein